METKICKQCWEEKPLTSEYWHKWNWKDWFCSKCRICRNKNNVEYSKTHKALRQNRVDAHKEHLRDYHRNYREINRDKLKEKNKQYYISVKDSIIKKYLQDNAEEISRKAKERREIMWYSKLHHDTDNYIDKYKIRPEKCSMCWWWWKIVAHHPSNDIRNEVVFCCYSCHQLIHTNKLECPKPTDLLTYKNKNGL